MRLIILLISSAMAYQWGVYEPVNGKVVLVDWFSDEGKQRLSRSTYTNDFFQIAHAYQPQINPVFASVASAVVVLNALRLPKHTIPSQTELEFKTSKETLPFPAYSQLTFLNEKTDKIKDRKLISGNKPGVGLEDLKKMLEEVYSAQAELTYADKNLKDGSEAFRNRISEILRESKRFIIANFKGDVMGAATGGTMSPVVAYDPHSDSVLILDVTGHKNPWYWAPLTAFYQAMNTQYDGHYRGYLVVSDKP